MARDPETIAHQEWLGYVQPVGLVVSIPALLAAQCHINRNIAAGPRAVLGLLAEKCRGRTDRRIARLRRIHADRSRLAGK